MYPSGFDKKWSQNVAENDSFCIFWTADVSCSYFLYTLDELIIIRCADVQTSLTR